MKRLTQLQIELQAVNARIDGLLAGDSMTPAQTAEHDRLVGEQRTLTRKIERERARQKANARQAAGARRTSRDGAGSGVRDVADPRVRVKDTDYSAIRDGRGRRTWGFTSHREFLLSVMAAGSGRTDPRLDRLYSPGAGGRQATVGSDEQRGNYDSAGGFLVPETFSPDFMLLEPENDPMAPYVTRLPMATPIVRIPARTDKDHSTSVSGGLTVTRRPETVAGTASTMTTERVTLEAHSLFGLAYTTEELLNDSVVSFIALLEKGFSDQFTYQLISERISGTGVGEFEGILNTPCLVSVAKETGQAASTIVYENVLNMAARCWRYDQAVWIANHNTLPQLGLLNQQVGTAGTGMIWQASAREGAPNVLLGRPIFFSEYPKTLGTQGDIILANWGEFLEGTYQPMQSAESIHVRFTNHERAFKFWLRNAGRWWWKTALTPKNGSTLSPAVVLDTRS